VAETNSDGDVECAMTPLADVVALAVLDALLAPPAPDGDVLSADDADVVVVVVVDVLVLGVVLK
jgi:hypothetical protein